MAKFAQGQVVKLGKLAPEWAQKRGEMREMGTGTPFLPFNGFGRVMGQYGNTVELQIMVGKPNGCWDGRVFRVNADELEDENGAQ